MNRAKTEIARKFPEGDWWEHSAGAAAGWLAREAFGKHRMEHLQTSPCGISAKLAATCSDDDDIEPSRFLTDIHVSDLG